MTETLLEELLDRSFLFDDPSTYRAGVVDAWSAIQEADAASHRDQAEVAHVTVA
ncbi:MAG: hypothetical protein KY461_07115 [Actinobacteria bacterium]|nr:hypothetical protein [Actinomycetota bacterium]